jgi:hypothetical protein
MTDRRSCYAGWLTTITRYLVVVAVGNLVWETAQLPLYTLWRIEPARTIIRSVLHCTAGDVVIATASLVLALATVGTAHWPDERVIVVAVVAVATGVAYTIGSEYVNTVLRESWAYTERMPTLPWIGTGLAPLAQWVVVPALALASTHRSINR